ncbi:UDP-glucose 4-epimerase GalE [Congregibacter litoralis]|uniref:UDP-glucose 4-epimerase n=1 Tax=Congregibacter litoralis KT71 TaxID=314285 RepID=A4ADJ0_9GAMM|nr:UDP-glucose 4-epimerase GalE [Congregibacter litoralis]EAQ95988.1 UDP-galactose 4-epimerase [Congregibacter litoralis KT71]
MVKSKRVLLTGGAGYIGSHSCVAFSDAGFEVSLLDNFSNSSPIVLERLEQILGYRPALYEADIRDEQATRRVLEETCPDAVIHFAGLKAVGESVAMPLRYYDNNVSGTLSLVRAMEAASVFRLVFSSSATVYGDPASVPITENFPRSATNPYGRSKLIVEDMLMDLVASNPAWKVALLRYFNPVGAHESGLIGEDPSGIPNNLMPFIAQVAVGRREKLSVFGGDYDTRDGTGVRDYIHVSDLAAGHVSAMSCLGNHGGEKPLIVNLGTGTGYSVLELVHAFEKASGRAVPYEIVDRRPGDVAQCYADPAYARQELGWETRFGVERMCEDAWRWQSQNPEGFRS